MAMLVVVELKTMFQESQNIELVGAVEKTLVDLEAENAAGARYRGHRQRHGRTRPRSRRGGNGSQHRGLDDRHRHRPLADPVSGAAGCVDPAPDRIRVGLDRDSASGHRRAWGWISPSRDLRVFIIVLAYGAGVDYCLFLIARFREELDGGVEPGEAIRRALEGVGGAITASALTVICGIAVLAVTRFQKIHEAGLVIPLALLVPLLGTLTFTAPLLRLTGRIAFWPRRPASAEHHSGMWEWIGDQLVRRPGAIWLAVTLAMLPFAIVAVWKYDDTNYNPLSELAFSAPAKHGERILSEHFPAGVLGPVTILLVDHKTDFSTPAGAAAVDELSRKLRDQAELKIADIRSIADPIGVSDIAKKSLARYKNDEDAKEAMRDEAGNYYVSQTEQSANHVTRLDLTLEVDPLTRNGIRLLGTLQSALPDAMPKALAGSNVHFVGPTASLRDLSEIKKHDQRLIQVLVPCVVFVLLLIVLRRPIVSAYLVVSVVFSYLCTLGVTWIVFRLQSDGEFLGLDWKVPIFLFTILVAVGEDYNIFLLTRVHEEEANRDRENAIRVALVRTGRVISSCGFLMAGTFASLLAGSLRAMLELGFALSFGVLLETMVVRPILVPSFLLLMHRFAPSLTHGGRSASALVMKGRPGVSESSTRVGSDGS